METCIVYHLLQTFSTLAASRITSKLGSRESDLRGLVGGSQDFFKKIVFSKPPADSTGKLGSETTVPLPSTGGRCW